MAKKRQVIRVRLPRYDKDHAAWRQAILDNILATGVFYSPTTDNGAKLQLEVLVTFYLSRGKGESIRDVDNLVKHVLDAFQGRFGDTRAEKRLIENDNIVRRVVMEKRSRPKNLSNEYGGKLVIRPYVRRVARD